MENQEFRKTRLRELVQEFGGNTALAKRLGYSNGSHIGNLLSGYRPITEKFIAKVEAVLRVPGWFSQSAHNLVSVPGSGQKKLKETIEVPLLTNGASMGSGETVQERDFLQDTIRISPQWVRENLTPVTNSHNLRFIHAYGDSMEPTFRSGDILLVDAGVAAPDVDGIYVLEADQMLFVKRITRSLTRKYTITSDNPTVKTVDVLDGSFEVKILGRVLWAWRGRSL